MKVLCPKMRKQSLSPHQAPENAEADARGLTFAGGEPAGKTQSMRCKDVRSRNTPRYGFVLAHDARPPLPTAVDLTSLSLAGRSGWDAHAMYKTIARVTDPSCCLWNVYVNLNSRWRPGYASMSTTSTTTVVVLPQRRHRCGQLRQPFSSGCAASVSKLTRNFKV